MKQLLLAVSCILTISLFSQKSVVVQHDEAPHVFDNLPDAIDFASDGDQVYISGGSFDLEGTLIIDKQLDIYGVGYKEEYVQSTGRSYLSGDIEFTTGSSNSIIQGTYITGDIQFNSTDTIYGITVYRCDFNRLFSGNLSGGVFSENNVRNVLEGQNSSNLLFEKNVFRNQVRNFTSVLFRNNLSTFTCSGFACTNPNQPQYRAVRGVISCTFENNIFRDPTLHFDIRFSETADFCTFQNNWLISEITNDGSNIVTSNISGYNDSFFTDYGSGDYNLNQGSPGSNAGTDSTDVGIYGTSEPFKENALPVNPHIVSKLFSIEDNVLQINVEVEAQRE